MFSSKITYISLFSVLYLVLCIAFLNGKQQLSNSTNSPGNSSWSTANFTNLGSTNGAPIFPNSTISNPFSMASNSSNFTNPGGSSGAPIFPTSTIPNLIPMASNSSNSTNLVSSSGAPIFQNSTIPNPIPMASNSSNSTNLVSSSGAPIFPNSTIPNLIPMASNSSNSTNPGGSSGAPIFPSSTITNTISLASNSSNSTNLGSTNGAPIFQNSTISNTISLASNSSNFTNLVSSSGAPIFRNSTIPNLIPMASNSSNSTNPGNSTGAPIFQNSTITNPFSMASNSSNFPANSSWSSANSSILGNSTGAPNSTLQNSLSGTIPPLMLYTAQPPVYVYPAPPNKGPNYKNIHCFIDDKFMADVELLHIVGVRNADQQILISGPSEHFDFPFFDVKVVRKPIAKPAVTRAAVTVATPSRTIVSTSASSGNFTMSSGNFTTSSSGNFTALSGNFTTSSGDSTMSSGNLTTSSSGNLTTSSSGDSTMTSGNFTTSSGDSTMSSGDSTMSSGDSTMSSGNLTTSSSGNLTTSSSGNLTTSSSGNLTTSSGDSTTSSGGSTTSSGDSTTSSGNSATSFNSSTPSSLPYLSTASKTNSHTTSRNAKNRFNRRVRQRPTRQTQRPMFDAFRSLPALFQTTTENVTVAWDDQRNRFHFLVPHNGFRHYSLNYDDYLPQINLINRTFPFDRLSLLEVRTRNLSAPYTCHFNVKKNNTICVSIHGQIVTVGIYRSQESSQVIENRFSLPNYLSFDKFYTYADSQGTDFILLHHTGQWIYRINYEQYLSNQNMFFKVFQLVTPDGPFKFDNFEHADEHGLVTRYVNPKMQYRYYYSLFNEASGLATYCVHNKFINGKLMIFGRERVHLKMSIAEQLRQLISAEPEQLEFPAMLRILFYCSMVYFFIYLTVLMVPGRKPRLFVELRRTDREIQRLTPVIETIMGRVHKFLESTKNVPMAAKQK